MMINGFEGQKKDSEEVLDVMIDFLLNDEEKRIYDDNINTETHTLIAVFEKHENENIYSFNMVSFDCYGMSEKRLLPTHEFDVLQFVMKNIDELIEKVSKQSIYKRMGELNID